MADFADLGADREEKDRALALKVRAPEGPSATGVCLYCAEQLADGMRWCDAECRDAWQADQRRGVFLYCAEQLADGMRWCDAECRDAWQADQRRGV